MHQAPQRTTTRYSKVEAGFRKAKIYFDLQICAARELEPHGIRLFTKPLPERLVPEHPAAPIAMLVATDMFSGCFLAAEIAPTTHVDFAGFALRAWRSHFEPMHIPCDHAPLWLKADYQDPLCAKGDRRG